MLASCQAPGQVLTHRVLTSTIVPWGEEGDDPILQTGELRLRGLEQGHMAQMVNVETGTQDLIWRPGGAVRLTRAL